MVGSPQHLHKRTQRFFVHQVCSPYFLPLQRPDSVHAERSGAGWSREAHQYPTIPPRVDYELTDLNGLEAPLRSRPTSHDHDGYEHTSSHTLFAAPYTPPVHSSLNPLKAGPWLRMRWPCGVRTGTTNTEPMQRTYQPIGKPQQTAGHRGSGTIHPQKPEQYRRRQADVICRCATPLLGRVTLCVSRHLGARESQLCWPADSAQATQGNSKPESRNAFWSNVKVQEQPALVPSAAMTASANDPCPSLSAIMALKTSCSFSTTSTSV
jgi:hypothetical protein